MTDSAPTARPTGPFSALPPQVDLPALERDVLDRWEAGKVFARTLEASPVATVMLDAHGGWQLPLARTLKRAGVAVDLNRLC